VAHLRLSLLTYPLFRKASHPTVAPMSSPRQQISESTFLLTSGRARLWAILIGVTHYQDEYFSELNYSAADCHALGEAIVAATQQFPNRRIAMHHNSSTVPPTLEAVRESLTYAISRADLQDTILFYFSGHGMVEMDSQEAVLCLSDTRNDALLGTGLQMNELLRMLERCDAGQQIVWLDACHSGALSLQGAKGVTRSATQTAATEPTEQFIKALRTRARQSKGFYAMLSCEQGQRSWEFPELGHGLFTYFLIRGLQGEAADVDGIISADTLYRYVYTQTVNFIQQKNRDIQTVNEQRRAQKEFIFHPEYPLQTPKRIVEGVGELVVGLQPEAIVTPPTSNPVSSSRYSPLWKPFLWAGAVLALISLIAFALLRFAQSPEASPEAPNSASTPSDLPASQACSITAQRLNPDDIAVSPTVDPQVILNACEPGQPWQQPKAQILSKPEPVWSTEFTPSGMLVSGGGREGGEIWNLENNQSRSFKGHTGWVYELAVSPDGETIATSSADQTVKLWNANTGTLIRTLQGHSGTVWTLDISPNGETIATGSADQTVKLWNLQTGNLIRTLEGHQDWVFSVRFAPDGQTLFSGSKDQTIKQWNVQTGQEMRTLRGHDNAVRSLAIAPNGETLASGSWDQNIKLWDMQTGQAQQTLSGHTDNVVSLAFSADSQTLASGSNDKRARLWDVSTQTLIGEFLGHNDWVLSVAFSPTGETWVSGDRAGTIILWQP
jgi:WD40 repeat protein